MTLSCPYWHISYSQYRFRVLSELCNLSTIPQISRTVVQRQKFKHPQAATQCRSYSSDDKPKRRKINPIPVESGQTVAGASTDIAHEGSSNDLPRQFPPRRKKFDPYSEAGRKDLKQIVDGLKILSQDAHTRSQKDEYLARGTEREKRRADSIPESPVLRRMAVKRETKKRATTEQTTLLNDPWAKILASPVRLCQATHARLPIRLMTNWGLMTHPETEEIFVMPNELADLEHLEKTREWKEEKVHQLREAWASGTQRKEDNTSVDEAPLAEAESHDRTSTLDPVPPSDLYPGNQPAIRLTPYANLIRLLTSEFTKPNPRNPDQVMTTAGAIGGKILSQRWHKRLAAAKYYLHQRSAVEQATGLKDFRPPPVEAQIDVRKLKWQWDVEERLLDILRRRVLLALERSAAANSSEKARKMRRISAVTIPSLAKKEFTVGGLSDDTDETTSEERPTTTATDDDGLSLSNDMTSSHNMTNQSHDNTSPSTSADPDTNTYKPLASRFFVHIGTSPLPTTYPFQPTTTSNHPIASPFIPPMIKHAPTHQSFPVFPLHAMLDSKHYAKALEITRQHPEVLRIRPTESPAVKDYKTPNDDEEEDYLILVKVRMAYTEVLLAELWRLWRYIGGQNGVEREGNR